MRVNIYNYIILKVTAKLIMLYCINSSHYHWYTPLFIRLPLEGS